MHRPRRTAGWACAWVMVCLATGHARGAGAVPGPAPAGTQSRGAGADTLRRAHASADTTAAGVLARAPVALEPVIVTSTRANRRIEDEPERVEVLAGEDVQEKAVTRPGDLTRLLAEVSGTRTQVVSASSGAARVRLQGMPGEFTATLVDGLPLAGADASGLGLLQIPPLDVRQAEVVKGAATALYGPAALGGVVNLIPRRPPDHGTEREGLLNGTSRGAADATLWLAHGTGDGAGWTLLGGAHGQRFRDVDADGWADLPHYARGELRPRAFWRWDGGRSLTATLGAMAEDRTGGADAALADADLLRREVIATRHADAGVTGRFPFGTAGVLDVRAAANATTTRHEFTGDPAALSYHDRRANGLAEATWLGTLPHGSWLVGAAVGRDTYHNTDLQGFDYGWTTPGAFAQATSSPTAWLTGSAAARVDHHPRDGTFASPRVSLLVHRAHALEARLSAGNGFFAPTPFTDETAALPLSRLAPLAGVGAERARNVSLDLTARRAALEFNATLFASEIRDAVQLLPNAAPAGAPDVSLVNVAGQTRTRGAEVYLFYDAEPLTITLNGALLDATEPDPATGGRTDVPLTPRQSAGLDVAWEEDESGTHAGVEVFYTGRQALENDPRRDQGAPYATVGVLVSQRVGRAMLYLNGDNLGDVRQSRWTPLLLPAPAPGGRLTSDVWAPLEGRVINGGVQVSW